jgi:5-carboxyvanillate decarboxylase
LKKEKGMKKIAVEEHFSTPEFQDLMRQITSKEYANKQVVEEERYLGHEVSWVGAGVKHTTKAGEVFILDDIICDVGDKRLKIMDDEGIDVAVLSFVAPGLQILDPVTGTAMSKDLNNWLADKVKVHPDRFVGLATLAPQDPVAAANEFERCVTELGMRGTLINSHTKGEYMDDKKFWPIFETAEKLGVPVYIHPRSPSPQMIDPYIGFPDLCGSMLGFAAETSLHAVRLMLSGVFDEYPNLKIILGHLGEAIPNWLWRIDNRLKRISDPSLVKHLPSYYFRNNFAVTTSGMYWDPAFNFAYQVLGADNILFASDFPFENHYVAGEFLDNSDISPADKEKVAHLNAERLFGI